MGTNRSRVGRQNTSLTYEEKIKAFAAVARTPDPILLRQALPNRHRTTVDCLFKVIRSFEEMDQKSIDDEIVTEIVMKVSDRWKPKYVEDLFWIWRRWKDDQLSSSNISLSSTVNTSQVEYQLSITPEVFTYGSPITGQAYSLRVNRNALTVNQCRGYLEDLLSFYPTRSAYGNLPLWPRGYLQWAPQSRLTESNITTTIYGYTYLDVVLYRPGGFPGLDTRIRFLIAYADTQTRITNPPPSAMPLLLLVSVVGEDTTPIYAVCKFDPTSSHLKHTGEVSEDGWEKVDLVANYLEVIDIRSERPELSDYQEQLPSNEDSSTDSQQQEPSE